MAARTLTDTRKVMLLEVSLDRIVRISAVGHRPAMWGQVGAEWATDGRALGWLLRAGYVEVAEVEDAVSNKVTLTEKGWKALREGDTR